MMISDLKSYVFENRPDTTEEMASSLVASYSELMPIRMAEIRKGIEEENLEKIKLAAINIKSIVSNLCLKDVLDLVDDLLEVIRSGDIDLISTLFGEIGDLLKDIQIR